MEKEPLETLQRRLTLRPEGRLDVHTKLQHFAQVNYALPKSRLEPHIPSDRFEIQEFTINGQRMALMSAVPFVDVDFHFPHLFPFVKFHFGQTNFRVYVIDKKTQEPVVWFFGTTLGSPVVYAARTLWKIPWHFARYQYDFSYDETRKRYQTFHYSIKSKWCDARIDLEDTGEPLSILDGFNSFDEMRLILTHPVAGYYYRLDHKKGNYSIWHAPLEMTMGRPRNLYFSLYEKLGLLSREEMGRPHSVIISPMTEFQIHLPPKAIE